MSSPYRDQGHSPFNQCEHPNWQECHPGCGHFFCPDCDLSFDEMAEGAGEPLQSEEDYYKELWNSYLDPCPPEFQRYSGFGETYG